MDSGERYIVGSFSPLTPAWGVRELIHAMLPHRYTHSRAQSYAGYEGESLPRWRSVEKFVIVSLLF